MVLNYLLGYPSSKVDDNGAYRPLFQRYNFKQDILDSVGGDLSILNLRRVSGNVRLHINQAPHIVIGRMIHVSLGNHFYTFDTSTCIWEKSKLFTYFWSDQEKNGLSPSNFYGQPVYPYYYESHTDNPPFGFCGRGILLDQNILIGVYCSPVASLVAFYLEDDEKGGRVVVKSQCITWSELGLPDYISSGRLVDIGRDGCICLAYVTPHDGYFLSNFGSIELKLIKVSQLGGDSDDIIKCEVVGTKTVLQNVQCNIADSYSDAFRA